MDGKFIMISGSAGPSCPADKLLIASQFIKSLTGEVLRRGGGLVVLAGNEESSKDEHGVPHVFDWIVLREVENFAESTTEAPRPYVRIIMSDEARHSKIDPANLRLMRNLEQRNVVELCPIRREVFTGGEYRKAMIERADAMIAIGGGKGTYSAGTEMIAQGKPLLPLDLQLGSIVQDGDGAVTLHREMVSTPGRFFPNTYQVKEQTWPALLGQRNQRRRNRGASVSRDALQGTQRPCAVRSVNARLSAFGRYVAGHKGPSRYRISDQNFRMGKGFTLFHLKEIHR